MAHALASVYQIVLALWIGGVAVFTFIVTPAVFKFFARDVAGQIVGILFPGYFLYNLVLSILALPLLLVSGMLEKSAQKWSMALIIAAILINVSVTFVLHPEIRKVKEEIGSFEKVPSDSPLRKKFGKLHAVSATLNLLLLADGAALLVLSGLLRRQ